MRKNTQWTKPYSRMKYERKYVKILVKIQEKIVNIYGKNMLKYMHEKLVEKLYVEKTFCKTSIVIKFFLFNFAK